MKQPFYSTLGGKIALIFFAGFVLVVLPVNVTVYKKLKSSLEKADEELLRAETEKLIPQIRLDPVAVPLPPLGYAVHIQIVSSLGSETIFESPAFPDVPEEMYFLENIDLDTTRMLNIRRTVNGNRELIFSMAKSNVLIENQLKEFRAYLFYLTGILILVIGLLIFLFMKMMLRPLRKIIQTAERVNASESMTRLPIPTTNDETKQLAITLNRMLERIEQSVNTQLQFFDSATHELKTPLAVMKAQLSYSLERKDHSINSLQDTLKEVERLERTISDFLLLSQLRSRTLQVRLEKCELADMVFSGIAAVKEIAETRRVNFNVNQDQSSYLIRADKDKIQTVIFNLLDNAVNYAPENSAIYIELKVKNDRVSLEIKNKVSTQIANAEMLGKARYTSTQSVRGMGLGLWICKQLLDMNDAEFGIDTDDLNFTVRIQI